MKAVYGFGTVLLAVLLAGTAMAGGMAKAAGSADVAREGAAGGTAGAGATTAAPAAADVMEEIVVTGEYPDSGRLDRSVLEAPVPDDVKAELQRSLDEALTVRLEAKLAL